MRRSQGSYEDGIFPAWTFQLCGVFSDHLSTVFLPLLCHAQEILSELLWLLSMAAAVFSSRTGLQMEGEYEGNLLKVGIGRQVLAALDYLS